MALSTRYLPVNAIIDDLLAEGQRVSVGAVRARLGSGSNQTISLLIQERLRERGHLPPAEAKDPAQIAAALQALRTETQLLRATAMAEHFGGFTNGRGHPINPTDPAA